MEFEDLFERIEFNPLIYFPLLLILVIIQYYYLKTQNHKLEQKKYEQCYIKQKPQEFELTKKELTQYHVKKLQEDPKFIEWQSQKKIHE